MLKYSLCKIKNNAQFSSLEKTYIQLTKVVFKKIHEKEQN